MKSLLKILRDFPALFIMGRLLSKAQKTTLTLGLLQQQAHVTSHIKGNTL